MRHEQYIVEAGKGLAKDKLMAPEPFDDTNVIQELANKIEKVKVRTNSHRVVIATTEGLTAGKLYSHDLLVSVALAEIVECRRVLKWTYAYGYYLPEDDIAKTRLFGCLQGGAEAALEKLNQCAEKELTEFLHDGTTGEFNSTLREKLANLTTVTETYFANLVKALGNGLADADSGVACSTLGSAHKKLKTGK
ncbi:hypothetical protein AgCh_026653 [Apium graveolens]